MPNCSAANVSDPDRITAQPCEFENASIFGARAARLCISGRSFGFSILIHTTN